MKTYVVFFAAGWEWEHHIIIAASSTEAKRIAHTNSKLTREIVSTTVRKVTKDTPYNIRGGG